MGSHAPSSSTSPEVERKRIIAPMWPHELPVPRRFCPMAVVMHRLRPVNKETPTPRRFSTMADVMRRSRPVDALLPFAPAREAIYDDAVVCDTCGSGDRGDELLLCDRCDRGRHTFCLRPIAAMVPIGPWFCSDCAPPVKRFKSFPMDQDKIIEFFRIQNDDQDGEPAKCRVSQGLRHL
ncbi:putative Histone-lysine N-methyltransferase ATXR5 [Panicum miliaceum]|uniref:Histone-lysine N-methyltransferase ATXR5 n=1 Tax=Panicum miliaceum TaxID=4540 RepID=A0A3L6Q1U3_PANMI|nr:putative Histone-lysine N-methyltransferase ATXR5 [Panicum miliaceum]